MPLFVQSVTVRQNQMCIFNNDLVVVKNTQKYTFGFAELFRIERTVAFPNSNDISEIVGTKKL